ncbi:uncharacterized protein DS421_1g10310 [Arachis hypogaea]|nr:uncharacterized protein DS421_1g10310 [Arachis hypogaea]
MFFLIYSSLINLLGCHGDAIFTPFSSHQLSTKSFIQVGLFLVLGALSLVFDDPTSNSFIAAGTFSYSFRLELSDSRIKIKE